MHVRIRSPNGELHGWTEANVARHRRLHQSSYGVPQCSSLLLLLRLSAEDKISQTTVPQVIRDDHAGGSHTAYNSLCNSSPHV